eukprot:TRINITY_DN83865_c0_g1_i1.p1 TRINITY_DN83865_c0_g1~~TRINITY_DN83865_c0_g1_i1.p1  ORF type:complete len:240 (-),score=64.77 TRINITY_DN83865_c0_g1_i1:69-788(-)
MAKFGSIEDLRKKEEEDKKNTNSYVGGDKSGLAVEHPDDAKASEYMAESMQQTASSQDAGPLPADHVVVQMYRNGFIVAEGPFRPLSDPLNRKFMMEIAKGRCPAELQARGGAPVHVAVHDKRGEDYKEPPPPALQKFSGEGNTLGERSAAPVEAEKGSVTIDDTKPKTKLQIRFHDGSRKGQEFNEEHTVGDLRTFCVQCVGQAMTIMGGFPPKPLSDDSLTLKEAGLLNSAVTVKPS